MRLNSTHFFCSYLIMIHILGNNGGWQTDRTLVPLLSLFWKWLKKNRQDMIDCLFTPFFLSYLCHPKSTAVLPFHLSIYCIFISFNISFIKMCFLDHYYLTSSFNLLILSVTLNNHIFQRTFLNCSGYPFSNGLNEGGCIWHS